MSERDKESSSFKVVDKRRFTSAGEVRSDAPPEEVKPDVPPPPPAPLQAAAVQKAPRGRPAQSRSSVDFMQFIASLATNAMAGLGLLPEAQARGMPANLQVAREYIDIIVMIQERTVGNLSPEEESSLNRLVNELRQQFAEVTQAAQAAQAAQASGPRMPGGLPGMPGGPRRR